jgi:REP element-mobilizing transposase RayT
MPNHVHLVCTPIQKDEREYYSLSAIMHKIKRFTARDANKILERTGDFWQHENWDHVVRDDGEKKRIIAYILDNPIKAGLVDDWKRWKWMYCKYELE